MGTLPDWLCHREKLLGFASHEELAESAGISVALLETMVKSGSLRGIGRSARGWLARSLKVTVRDLERLASGKIEWIEDSTLVDFERLTPDALRVSRRGGNSTPQPFRCEPGRGVPIVGRVLGCGSVEFDGASSSQDARRLPVKYRGAPDAFALETCESVPPHPAGVVLVLRSLPAGELQSGELALIARADGDGESLLFRVRRAEDASVIHLKSIGQPDAERAMPLEMIVRASRVLGAHPPLYRVAGLGE